MKSIVNKTTGAVRVPLPQGKMLHLGPRQTGYVSVHAVDHPPLVKMVEAGQLDIQDEAGNEAIPETGRGRHPSDR